MSGPSRITGLLPAAGRGMRFGRSGYIKELYPLFDGADPTRAPRPLCDVALAALHTGGAERCVVVVSPEKAEILRVLSDGRARSLDLCYVVQDSPLGLPNAIACARSWLGDDDVLFALPDTIALPGDALRQVHELRCRHGADVVLGIFPVDEPERFGPVELDADGRVLRVWDKPSERTVPNTWAVAAWSARFTAFCADWDSARASAASSEGVLGDVFEAAHRAGLHVRGLPFSEGVFLDAGTPSGLRRVLDVLSRSQQQ